MSLFNRGPRISDSQDMIALYEQRDEVRTSRREQFRNTRRSSLFYSAVGGAGLFGYMSYEGGVSWENAGVSTIVALALYNVIQRGKAGKLTDQLEEADNRIKKARKASKIEESGM